VAFDTFMKIEGIPGESKITEKHRNEVDVLSWSWGMNHPISGGGGPEVEDFRFRKTIDKATPILFLSCCDGKHIDEATLTVSRHIEKVRFDYYKVKMTDVIVTSVGPKEGDMGPPTEEVSFNFSKIEMTYIVQKADGTAGQKYQGECLNPERT
jgi:type VI secretion system secreted protein Hcp